ncbi:hypothetical protein LTR64_000615 [Lithohypha guttulata]|uniref:Uncharacterized protein n=1 Tax=Lithohypha guttulata TaxID=1690604 RepID=A0AAN7T0N5_9EURO|nr:hypothetical protein LTR51_005619 [Lithohypha guttulata]KAK5086631.1 hypothetical protein LTR05_003799 [Lithohypha guttulata]
MFSKALLLLLTVIAGALAAGVTNILNGTLQYTSTDAVDNVSSYTFQDPFCIVDVNLVDYSWAIVILRDGSKTEAGYDAAGDCGGRFKREMQGGKLVALTKWHCHYGPENSACITFNSPLLWSALSDYIYPTYAKVTDGVELHCEKLRKGKDAVCPAAFNDN